MAAAEPERTPQDISLEGGSNVRLQSQRRRIAACKVGDKLVTTRFAVFAPRGFAAIGERSVAICLLPGTELAFERDVEFERAFFLFGPVHSNHKVARFRPLDTLSEHRDAIELPDGQIVLVTRLMIGQTATVLQLPSNLQVSDRTILHRENDRIQPLRALSQKDRAW